MVNPRPQNRESRNERQFAMIENKEEGTTPDSHHLPQPEANPSHNDEAPTQPASTEPTSDAATAVHQSEQPISTQPETEPTVTTIQVPASTIFPQPENSTQATVAPALPHMSIDDLQIGRASCRERV